MARFLETTRFSRTLQHVTESMESLSSLRCFGVVERFCNHFCHLTDYHLKGYATFCAYYRFSRTLGNLCGFAVVLASILFMLWNFSGGDSASSSGLGLALSASLSIPQTIVSLNFVIFIGPQLLVCFERGLQYTELPEEDGAKQESNDKNFKMENEKHIDNNWPTNGRVEFENYCASYRPGVLSNVLKGITLLIEPCQKVGVVGRTGAGKSSLVLALLRILKTTSGNIRIDGIDIGTVPLCKLRSSLTVIPQDPNLVRGTLRSNLDPTGIHNDKDLWKALEQAHLAEFVSAHPDKLLLETGDGGASLSVGQRQLVSLARALLRRSKVLILDEATAQMDSNTDTLVQATLRSSFADCTVITVAHRIHTILDYDMVIVMADGVVQEFGPVTQLLSNPNSAFRRMAGSDDMTHL
ncbi:ATP-binding cassette sub-family C member 3-like [Ixodes scapularis]|uniref:ATP-binding cassette sub-family C member 3-like n=1 Tax=Ixodes scapularis TaxID=6945 RepID=UPI001C38F10D|nr:ATP-binding cassette sub-family C member 3-like [Ixodes scapularis]